MDEVFGLFPIPFLRARATLHEQLVARLVEHFSTLATRDNNSSGNLSHTEMLQNAGIVPKDFDYRQAYTLQFVNKRFGM